MTSSHVFVTMGSLTSIACDAWMLPTDHNYSVRSYWTDPVPGLGEAITSGWREDFANGSALTQALHNWEPGLPLPVLTAVPSVRPDSAAALVPALHEFIHVASRCARDRLLARSPDPKTPDCEPAQQGSRPNPLLAIPLFGTGGGGAGAVRGEVVHVLLEECRRVAGGEGVDIVLVVNDEHDFALAQELRKRSANDWWDSLRPDLQTHATELSAVARQQRLVPFMGSGVSVSAGAPDWKKLIGRLAKRIGLSKDETKALTKRDVLDQAGILRSMYDDHYDVDGLSFNQAVAAEVTLDRYGLAPALLASLPSRQAITLNYDEQFEKASQDMGTPRVVIPNNNVSSADSWLLKLHGSVSKPDSIVLTRDDYLGYSATKEALSALVKATLITHHLLFVGFGLSDDHFHEIIHDVRQALPEEVRNSDGFATALTLFKDPLDERVWKNRLSLVPMSDGVSVAEAARTLEIFLDMLLAYATDSHSYLLADGFIEALTPPEKSLRTKVERLIDSLDEAETSCSGGVQLAAMFRRLGAP